MKYNIEYIFLIELNGSSAGIVPIFISIRYLNNIVQNVNCRVFENVVENFILYVGIVIKIAIDMNSAITPLDFLGIDRKIEYDDKKYHSG